MKYPACFMAAIALSACATVPDDSAEAMIWTEAEGSEIGLFEAVVAGDLVVEPQRIIEDSRCPINARCVWAGEINVLIKVYYDDQYPDEFEISLGEPVQLRGHVLQMTSAEPGRMAGADPIAGRDYRFTFASWREDSPPE